MPRGPTCRKLGQVRPDRRPYPRHCVACSTSSSFRRVEEKLAPARRLRRDGLPILRGYDLQTCRLSQNKSVRYKPRCMDILLPVFAANYSNCP